MAATVIVSVVGCIIFFEVADGFGEAPFVDVDGVIPRAEDAAAADALRSAGDLTGKTIVDISNPVTPDYSALALGFSTSAAEEIQKAGSPRQRS